MNYSTQILCMYCDQPVSRTAAKQHTCPKCWSNMVEQFGETWHEEDWHRTLLPGYVKFVNDSKAHSHALSIERDEVDFAEENVVRPVEAKPVRHANVYQAVYTLYVTKGFGGRRIKRELDHVCVQPKVSLQTIKRYLRMVKRDVAAAQSDVVDSAGDAQNIQSKFNGNALDDHAISTTTPKDVDDIIGSVGE